ncbi:MAG: hypothetical protein WBC44_04855 [Planctomycetaceae bacterium]
MPIPSVPPAGAADGEKDGACEQHEDPTFQPQSVTDLGEHHHQTGEDHWRTGGAFDGGASKASG